jgi:hypothetical protein
MASNAIDFGLLNSSSDVCPSTTTLPVFTGFCASGVLD